jgi:hypothetical protein
MLGVGVGEGERVEEGAGDVDATGVGVGVVEGDAGKGVMCVGSTCRFARWPLETGVGVTLFWNCDE